MTYYIIAALAGLAAWFYALYQRSQRVQAELALAQAKKDAAQAQANEVAERVRYEALVADLKKQLKSLEDSFDATATPDAVRARFRELFPSPAQAPASGPGVPPGPAAGPGAGPAVRLP